MDFCKENNITIYDFGSVALDRITVVLNYTKSHPLFGGRLYDYKCISASWFGKGVFQHSNCQKGRHLGKKVSFDGLSFELKEKLYNYFKL